MKTERIYSSWVGGFCLVWGLVFGLVFGGVLLLFGFVGFFEVTYTLILLKKKSTFIS